MTEVIDKNLYNKYKKVAQTINSAGGTPFAIGDTLISIVKLITSEEDLDFILAFRKQKSQTLEQLKDSSNLTEDEILEKVTTLN